MSQLQQERSAAASCSNCGCRQALTIDMTVGKAGPRVSLTSCPRCEHRVWSNGTAAIPRTDVLQVLSGREDFVLVEKPSGTRRRAA